MERRYAVGQKVAVNLGGCVENRTEGVIASIKERPELVTYEVRFPEHGRDGVGIERFYMWEQLTPLD